MTGKQDQYQNLYQQKRLHIRIILRTITIPLLMFILIFLAYWYLALPSIKENLIRGKKSMIREQVTTTWNILNQYHKRFLSGELSEQAAQKGAIEMIRGLRYGEELKDYFWINDLQPVMVMHPYVPELERKNIADYRDKKGKKLFIAMVDVCRKNGAGYVDYHWQWKDDPDRLEPKISFVKLFKPWNWIIGTGLYINDVNDTVNRMTRRGNQIFIVIILVILLFTSLISFNSIRSERARELGSRALHREKEYLRITLNSIGDGVITVDLEGKVIKMNPVAEILTGWRTKEARGRLLTDIFHVVDMKERQPVICLTDELESDLLEPVADHFLVDRNQREYRISCTVSPILDRDETREGSVLIFKDVTQERTFQERLLHNQKMDAIGQLAGGVAHDFNNMLGGIIGGIELLRMILPHEEQSDKYLTMIMNAAEHAADLAGNLLTFARRQSIITEALDIHHIIREVVAILENTINRNVIISTELEARGHMVMGDVAQLQSLFMNLGINASHAMEQGGELSIRTECVMLSETYCKASSFKLKPGRFIEIEVRDTGTGIEQKDIRRIFEPFFTTKEQGKGTGLGLAAVYGTVQQHYGAIIVYSEPGTGTSFHIYLPLTGEAAGEITSPGDQPVTGTGTILLVDDESVMRATGSALLEGYGYNVITALNGEEAVEIFQKEHQKIDLVLLDMIMPVMNGRECFTHLKKIKPEVIIILTSGFTKSDDLNDLNKRGLAGFIRKPFRGNQLSQIVAEAINKG